MTISMWLAMWILHLKPCSEILKEGTIRIPQVCFMKHINAIFSWWRVSINIIPWHKDRLIIIKYREIGLQASWGRVISNGSCRISLKIAGWRDTVIDCGWKSELLAFSTNRSWIFSLLQRWWGNIGIISIVSIALVEVATIVAKVGLIVIVIVVVIIPLIIMVSASFPISVVSIIGGPITTV